jgi:hypothetical protein
MKPGISANHVNLNAGVDYRFKAGRGLYYTFKHLPVSAGKEYFSR